MLDRSSVTHDVRLPDLLDAAAWLQEELGKPVPSSLLKAGGFPGSE